MNSEPAARPDPGLFDKVVNLTKRRGFVYPSAEIYGGFRSTYDYGPLGVLLLRNVKDAWWRSMVQLRHDVVGLDAAILSPPAVWEASGHLQNFTDPLVDCRNCRERFRLDKLDDPEVKYVIGLLAASCIGIGVYLYSTGAYDSFSQSIRHATFNIVTIATDSGYATQDFDRWNQFARSILFLSMLIPHAAGYEDA